MSKGVEHTETIELSIDSKLDNTEVVSSVTKSVAARMGFNEDDTGWIELAVHEAVINAIAHGNKYADDKQVDIRFEIGQETLTILVRDRGEGFDPSKLPNPLDEENLLNPNGRGILYMRTFMDAVEHTAHPEGGSVVRLTKVVKPATAESEGRESQ